MFGQKGAIVPILLVMTIAILMAAVGTMALLGQGNLSGQAAQTDADLSYLEGVIANLLLSEVSCRKALGGPAVYNTPPSLSPQPYNPAAGPPNYNPITIYRSDGVTKLFCGATDPTCTTPANYTFGHPQLVIQQIFLKHRTALPSGSYWADLYITAKKGGNLEGSSIISKSDVRVVIQTDGGGNIMSCSSLSFMGSDLQPMPVCLPGQALYSNGLQIRCVRTICPAATTLDPTAYMSDGSACCRPGGVGPCVYP